MLRRILVPLDGSVAAECALSCARPLAIRTGARLSLVRAVAATEFGRPVAWDCSESEDYLEGVATQLQRNGFVVDSATLCGEAAKRVAEEAECVDDTLIIMATHARTGLSRWIRGGMAEAITAVSPVPVVLARAGRPPQRYRLLDEHVRLVITVDGSLVAHTAIPVAARLAVQLDADLVMTFLDTEPLQVRHARDGDMHADIDHQEVIRRTRAMDYLRLTGQSLAEHWPRLTIHTEVRFGDPSSSIVRAADEWSAALVIMASRKRTGLHRTDLGTIPRRVLDDAPAPLVVVGPCAATQMCL